MATHDPHDDQGDAEDPQADLGRYQGGTGGYRSNAGLHAGSQTYGGDGDQLGYGSGDTAPDADTAEPDVKPGHPDTDKPGTE